MVEEKLPIKTLILWQIRMIVAGLFGLGLLTYTCVGFSWYLSAALITIVFLLVLILWYVPAIFKSYKISYINGAVVIEKGVIIKTTHVMPYSKMIYTQSITTPLAKLFGLSAITLKAARSRIFIPEFPKEGVEEFARKLAEGEE